MKAGYRKWLEEQNHDQRSRTGPPASETWSPGVCAESKRPKSRGVASTGVQVVLR